MISRRDFASIIMMMAALLFMFQFSQIIKENASNYDINEYAADNPISGEGRWKDKTSGGWHDFEQGDTVFVGDKEGAVGRTVSQWCNYTKRNLMVVDSISGMDVDKLPSLVLVDSENIDFDKETETFIRLTQSGVSLIFCNLPQKEVLQRNDSLTTLLGISQIHDEMAELEGVHLFADFLLGGEAIYKAQNPNEEDMQDLELSVPWYVAGKGTKTYMVGMMDEHKIEREDFPALIWRRSYGEAMVFAVNGNYLDGFTGLGILDAMVYEMNGYTLYPVVNAQNMTVVDFPVLAEENAEGMEAVYSRSPEAVMRDVMWPGITSMSLRNKLKLTCCINSQYDYTDDIWPDDEQLPFYLQQMREIGAEAGLSFGYGEGVTFEEKIVKDREFYDSVNSDYRFAAAYVENLPEDMDMLFDKETGFGDIGTLAFLDGGEMPVLSYYGNEVTLQRITGDAGEYTYSMDLQMRSLATALGYSNTIITMHNAMWPESEEDQWEIYFDDIFSNVSTYWTRYRNFENTTLSESDRRIRNFLNLDYNEERNGNRISLYLEGADEDTWFVLRIHGEDVADVKNGSFQRLESGAYLICAESEQVEIKLKKSRDVLEYSGAFAK